MATFTMPSAPVYNVTNVTKIETQDVVEAEFVNAFYQIFLQNDAYLKAQVDAINAKAGVTGVKGSSESSYRTGNVNITKANIGLSNVANFDQSKAIKSISRSGTTFTATALDGTTFTFTQQDSNTTYAVATQSVNGLMSAADKKKLDGITAGAKPYSNMTGASASAAGSAGLVPAPATGAANRYLRSDGTWSVPPDNDTKDLTSMAGVLPTSKGGTGQTDSNAAANALINALGTAAATPTDNDYYVCQYAGGGTDITSFHRRPISALWNWIKTKITKQVVTDALGYTPPTTNTTYGTATTSANGLMSSTDKSKLDGVQAGAQKNAVTSVAGKTGAVALTKGDVGLGSVDNTADANKNVASAGTIRYEGRPASANMSKSDAKLHYFLATSSMTSGRPASDAYILHFGWDNSHLWDAQLAIPDAMSTDALKAFSLRVGTNANGKTQNDPEGWSSWMPIYYEGNHDPTAVYIGGGEQGDDTTPVVASDSELANVNTKVSKAGDTMTGKLYLNDGSLAIGCRRMDDGMTLEDMFIRLRQYGSTMGSVYLIGSHGIPNQWYNFIYISHRTGSMEGDNSDYGTLLLMNLIVYESMYMYRVVFNMSNGAPVVKGVTKINETSLL